MERLIIIPARKGSKGLPNKNKLILGKIPLIQWSIEHALNELSGYDVLVTTDDLEIINLCKKLKVGYRERSEDLASDSAMMIDVLADALSFYEQAAKKKIEEVILLQPTFPFRTNADAINFKKLLDNFKFDNIVSVIQVNDTHPARMYKIQDNYLVSIDEKYNNFNRQDLPPIYLRNGAYYAFKSQLIRERKLYGQNILPFVMDENNRVNIDAPIDYLFAKLIYEESIKS